MNLARPRLATLGGALAAALTLLTAACGGGSDANGSASGLEASEIKVGVMPIVEAPPSRSASARAFSKPRASRSNHA